MTADLNRIEKRLWNLLLLLIPISASPLLPLGSGTLVRPLSLVPALALSVLAGGRLLILRQWPRLSRDASGWLLLFTFYAVIAGLIEVIFLPGDPFKGQTPTDSFIRALATLAIGLLFFTMARLHIRTAADIRNAIFWLFAGLCASIGFAVIQVIAMVARGPLLHEVQILTDFFAVHQNGLDNRAQGMTLEPSWLATQILLLMLPPLVACVISRQAWPGGPVRGRNILLACAGFAIALTGLLCAGSRFGLASAVVMLMLAGLMAVWRGRVVAALAFLVLLAGGGAGMVAFGSLSAGAGASYVLGPVDYLTNGVQSGAANDPDIATTATDALSVAGRAAAGQAAFDLWLDHPLFGISLGNTYRYFSRYAPDWAFATGLFTIGRMEGADWLDPGSPLKANAKNFILRLLAETGLIGFVLFAIFVVREIFAGPARDKFSSIFRLTSTAALMFSFFNQDSFADPALWIVLVLCQAMGNANVPEFPAAVPDGMALPVRA